MTLGPQPGLRRCADGHELSPDEKFCGLCGTPPSEAVARYELQFEEFAADGVLEPWEEEELRIVRRELNISDAAHSEVARRFDVHREMLPVGVEVDANTFVGLAGGAAGTVRVRFFNGGQRPVRNVVVRHAVTGRSGMFSHNVRIVPPGQYAVFALHMEELKPGQHALLTSVRVEDMSGKKMRFLGAPIPFTVARAEIGGPQTVVANIDASSMRVGDLSGLKVGTAASAGGVINTANWESIALRSVVEAEWLEWEDAHDEGKRRRAQLEQFRLEEEQGSGQQPGASGEAKAHPRAGEASEGAAGASPLEPQRNDDEPNVASALEPDSVGAPFGEVPSGTTALSVGCWRVIHQGKDQLTTDPRVMVWAQSRVVVWRNDGKIAAEFPDSMNLRGKWYLWQGGKRQSVQLGENTDIDYGFESKPWENHAISAEKPRSGSYRSGDLRLQIEGATLQVKFAAIGAPTSRRASKTITTVTFVADGTIRHATADGATKTSGEAKAHPRAGEASGGAAGASPLEPERNDDQLVVASALEPDSLDQLAADLAEDDEGELEEPIAEAARASPLPARQLTEAERGAMRERNELVIVAADGSADARLISEGVERVREGGIVEIEPGQYADALVVAKPMTIRAAKSGTVEITAPPREHPAFKPALEELAQRREELQRSLEECESRMAGSGDDFRTHSLSVVGEEDWWIVALVLGVVGMVWFGVWVFGHEGFFTALGGLLGLAIGYGIGGFAWTFVTEVLSPNFPASVGVATWVLVFAGFVGSGGLLTALWGEVDGFFPTIGLLLGLPLAVPLLAWLAVIVVSIIRGPAWEKRSQAVSDAKRIREQLAEMRSRESTRLSALIRISADAELEGLQIRIPAEVTEHVVFCDNKSVGHLTIKDCGIKAGSGIGVTSLVWLAGPRTAVRLENCELRGGHSGLVVKAGTVEGRGLSVAGARDFGVWCGGERVEITSGSIERCGVGIRVAEGIASLKRLRISHCVGHGAYWASKTKGGRFERVVIEKCGAWGMAYGGETHDNYVLSGCTFTDNLDRPMENAPHDPS